MQGSFGPHPVQIMMGLRRLETDSSQLVRIGSEHISQGRLIPTDACLGVLDLPRAALHD